MTAIFDRSQIECAEATIILLL